MPQKRSLRKRSKIGGTDGLALAVVKSSSYFTVCPREDHQERERDAGLVGQMVWLWQ